MSNYFFGSYFKLQSNNKIISIIPSYSKVNNKYMAHLQIITDDNSYILDYPYELYKRGKGFNVTLDNNIFNEKGISLDINKDNVILKGNIVFNGINKLNKNIMGPFKFIPFMECIHSVHNIKSSISGKLILNGTLYDFNNGYCYIEGDKGRSFPKVYSWTQAIFDNGSLMLSVARIPFGLFNFTGVIGFVNYDNKNIIFGTYNRAKALKIKEEEIIIKQGKYKFIIKLLEKNPFDLAAPLNGKMDRIIKEAAKCKVHYKLLKNDDILLDIICDNASMEYEYKKEYEIDRGINYE